MNRFQQMLVQAHLATVGFIGGVLPAPEDRESGQSSAEYAGIVVVAVTLVLALVSLTQGWADAIGNAIMTKIGELG